METEEIDFDNTQLLWVIFANELASETKNTEN
jgi:hypothetical protein